MEDADIDAVGGMLEAARDDLAGAIRAAVAAGASLGEVADELGVTLDEVESLLNGA